MMTRITWLIVPAALGLALTGGTYGVGDEPRNPPAAAPKSAGEQVDQAVQSTKRGVQKAGETLREEFERARASIHDMGVHGRVYGRLHWDKDLTDSKIEIEMQGGTAVLRGTVQSLQAKTKAATLVRDTVGVERVDDRLTIESAAPAAKVKG
jgi:osmotically-inducible protein OsmY